VDSHDSDRIMYLCNNDKELLRKVLKIIYNDSNGRNDPVVIYYGTEVLMSQSKTIHNDAYGDYRCRLPMKFIS